MTVVYLISSNGTEFEMDVDLNLPEGFYEAEGVPRFSLPDNGDFSRGIVLNRLIVWLCENERLASQCDAWEAYKEFKQLLLKERK